MEFDWDAANTAHIARHQVLPIEAEQAVTDPERVAAVTYTKNGEARVLVTGLTYDDRLLTVIVTTRGGKFRVVTARPASAQERLGYEERSS